MTLQRRSFLRLISGSLATGGLLALAGCSSSCPDNDRPNPDHTVSIGATPTGPLAARPGGSWPTIHGDPGNTGYSTASLPKGDIALRWRHELDLPISDEGTLSASAPAVGSGMVVVADSRGVTALSVESGEELWRHSDLPVTAHDTISEYQANTATPTIGPDGTVYVGAQRGLVVLDGSDGTEAWSVEDLSAVVPPRLVDGTVFAMGKETLVAVDQSGAERWRRSIAGFDTLTPPAVGSERIVAPVSGDLKAFETESGADAWERDRTPEGHPAISNERCLVGDFDGLHGLDLETGESQWSFSRGEHRALVSPAITPETIYAVEQPGEAGDASFALDRTDGEPEARWCSYIGSGAVTAATDDLALAVLQLGEGPEAPQSIAAFSASLGEAVWAIEGGSRPADWVTPPAVLEDTVIATTRGGTVVAVSGGT